MPKIKMMGKFNGDEATLPQAEKHPGAVRFREPERKQFAILINILAMVLMVLFFIPVVKTFGARPMASWAFFAALVLSMICAVPHEFLHAICFPKEAFIYTNLKEGMLFVVSTDPISKARFIFMSLLPSLVFGLLPYGIGLLTHNFFLAVFGAASLSMGAGDYFNVYNALVQMPADALTYLDGFHSFWYQPETAEKRAAAPKV